MNRKIAVSVFLLFAGAALYADDPVEPRAINVYNRTGYSLRRIFVTTGETGYWGPDILRENEELENGEVKGILLHPPETDTGVHFMAMDAEGYTYMIYDRKITVEKPDEIVFRFDHFLEAAPELEFVNLKVVNRTVPLYRLFVAPEESPSRGADLLYGEVILETGDSVELLLPAQREAVSYAVYAVDEDLDDYLVRLDLGIERPDADNTVTVSIEVADQLF